MTAPDMVSTVLKFIESNPWLFAIVSGLLVTAIGAVLVRTTKWAGPVLKALWNGLLALLKWLFSIRITTEPRICRRVENAVHAATQPPSDFKFWQWTRDRQPGVWLLENHTGETCTVVDVDFDSDSGWYWSTYPNFPIRVRDGGSVELRGSITTNLHVPYVSDNPGATVQWADSHLDQKASWGPFEDGSRFI